MSPFHVQIPIPTRKERHLKDPKLSERSLNQISTPHIKLNTIWERELKQNKKKIKKDSFALGDFPIPAILFECNFFYRNTCFPNKVNICLILSH